MSLTLPAELAQAVRDELPDLCVSKVLQEALRARLGCTHDEFGCANCGFLTGRRDIVGPELHRFLAQLLWDLTELVDQGGTAEGAARVIRDIGERWGIPGAEKLPVPKASRKTREWIRAQLRNELRAELEPEYEAKVRAERDRGRVEVIEALEGAGAVEAWMELGGELERRGGWVFAIDTEGTPSWQSTTQPEVWATAEQLAERPAEFDLWRREGFVWLDDDDQLTGEEGEFSSLWIHTTPADLVVTANRLAHGETIPPDMELGPWVEERLFERLHQQREGAGG